MTIQNSDAVVSAELNGGTTIRWYSAITGGTQLGQGTSWKTGDKGTVVVTKDYFAAQEKEGCFSDRKMIFFFKCRSHRAGRNLV